MTKAADRARFLLTFDDGPHACTPSVLKQLANNPLQQDIKAIFFVQTRNVNGAGSRFGRSLLHLEHEQGHVLGLHTATEAHVSHTSLSPTELDHSLREGMEDLRNISQEEPLFVRPPYWRYNSNTLAEYARHDLHMMLSDAKAYDGVEWGLHIFRRLSFRAQLRAVCRRIRNLDIPLVEGIAPIVVTFHDTNAYTASHLADYVELLVEQADRLRLPLDNKPFYDAAPDIARAGLCRAVGRMEPAMPEPRCAEAL